MDFPKRSRIQLQILSGKGGAVDAAAMKKYLEQEVAEYYAKLRHMLQESKNANNAGTSTPYAVARAKTLYHRLAKLIHPDINPETDHSEELQELWSRSLIAYHHNDVKELAELEVLVRKVLKDLGAEDVKVEIPDIEEKIDAVKTEIDQITHSEPYTLRYLLAMYYRDIKEFGLEQRYLELAAKCDDCFSKEQLGFIAYYGLTGEQDFEKAYQYFSECKTRRSQYMIADMYHYGQYVRCDRRRCREILEDLFEQVEPERNDPSFVTSTLFPEIAQRLVQLDLEEGTETDYDWNSLLDARAILTKRQQESPFWGNILTMRSILETMREMRDRDDGFIDLYDLLKA